MSKIHFTMVPRYASGWGVWEGLREVMQNAFDANDLENPMEIYYKEGSLFVENIGTQIGIESFLLGETDKEGEESLRGTHGEGLTLASMAFCREGIASKVFSGDFCWTPSIEHVENLNGVQLNRDLFTITQAEDFFDPFYGVKVQIEIEETLWEKFKPRFLPLIEDEMSPDEIYRCYRGAILLGERFKGQIFSQGIYVQTKENFAYGYDLKLKLDRDRNTIPDFDVEWDAGKILSSYETHMEKQVAYKLVCEGSRETRYLDMGQEANNRFGEVFQEEHGEDAVPVTTDEEAKNVRRVGMNPVIVSEKAKEILSKTSVKIAVDLKKNYSVQVLKRYDLSDLESRSRRCFERAVGEIQSMVGFCKGSVGQSKDVFYMETGVSEEIVSFLTNTEIVFRVVELSDLSSNMMVCKDLCEVGVSRKTLSGMVMVLRVLVQGVAHLAYEKGKIPSVSIGIEDLWSLLLYKEY